MIARLCFVSLAILLAGCAVDVRDFNREPHMTPVGSGMVPKRVSMVTEPSPPPVYRGNSSIWQDSHADLFSDLRARKIGDTVTVKIYIKDKASIANDSERKRDASNKLNFGATYGATSSDITIANAADLGASAESKTKTKSEGGIERSEKIELLIAAVVSDVLPNGNLVISGSQEVRVNYELRVLNVAGIVRPVDISAENTIAYEKIAEARIAYGGRGRLMEVQQPPWGQQLADDLLPW
ncbi:flagellar basal body L-ring protein FlgH [Hyphomicrobium sp. NDB2Meth4]|uniref:flagellar basal body L-ring protein FlgH n=1 Tax=Hyphomicrobium sp. NDB2Meth4 TaxID=1892846 RepID=UPI0009305162|nr:flagellar basal body L-ring protein FlgH [Hyphomicrobium sp. NDB2Meth4]